MRTLVPTGTRGLPGSETAPPVSLSPTLAGGATAALTGSGGQHLSMWAGGLLLAGYGLAIAAIGSRLTIRRDIT